MKPAVTITWAALLAGSYAVVVPTLVTLLQQSFQAARQIESYTAKILEHAGGIERNTAQAAALKQTRAVAPRLLVAGGALEGHTASIAAALDGSAGNSVAAGAEPGQEPGEEAQP